MAKSLFYTSAWLLCIFAFGCAPPTIEPPAPTLLVPPSVLLVSQGDTPKADEKQVFSTIGAAIAASKQAGASRIFVYPGTYKETIVLPKDQTLILSAQAGKPVTIEAPAGKPAITLETGAKLTLHDFIIQGGQRGVLLSGNNEFHATNSTFKGMVGQAIFGNTSTVTLAKCIIQEIKDTPQDLFKQLGQAQGVRLTESELTVTGSTFQNTLNRGINLLNNSTGIIKHSTFTQSAEFSVAAIAFQDGGKGTIDGVSVTGWKEGVFSVGSQVTVRNSTFKQMKGNAIFLTQESWGHIQDVVIESPAKTGVSFSISHGVVANTTITAAGDYGIFAVQGKTHPALVFENNHVTDSKASGIQVVNAFAIIRSNTVKDSVPGQAGDDGYGIGALDSDRIIVEGNTVEGCRSAGIFINRSAGQILGNKVKGNKEGGILITSALPEFPLEVHNNQVDANTVAGIFLLTSNGHLQGNIVTNTVFSPTDQSGTGVVVFGQSNVTIEKDRYEANQQHGLLIAQNSTAKVSNTSFTDNKQFGMVVQCTNSTVEETKNEYTKNGQGDRTKCP